METRHTSYINLDGTSLAETDLSSEPLCCFCHLVVDRYGNRKSIDTICSGSMGGSVQHTGRMHGNCFSMASTSFAGSNSLCCATCQSTIALANITNTKHLANVRQDPKAQFILAMALEAESPARSMIYAKKSASLGYAPAMTHIAFRLYQKMKKSYEKLGQKSRHTQEQQCDLELKYTREQSVLLRAKILFIVSLELFKSIYLLLLRTMY